MLYIVLLLVAAALAGVVAALITAESLWAWISIGLSALAGLLLLVDWFRRRSSGTSPTASEPAADAEGEHSSDQESTERAEPVEETETAAETGSAETETAEAEAAETEAETAAGETDSSESSGISETAEATDEPPGEEETDAADALIVSGLDVEVLVVDEYPRYHLAKCGWLTGRDTIPIAVSEARDLGFSPCARCGPDSVLAAKHRKTRKKFRSRAE